MLKKQQNIDAYIKGSLGRAPIHCTWKKDHLPISVYLISNYVNIEGKYIYIWINAVSLCFIL